MPDAFCQSTFSNSPANSTQSKSRGRNLLTASLLAIAIPAAAQTAGTYTVTNLVSDGSVPATITDPNFINPWGVTNATFWINAQATGFDYVVSPTNFPPFTPPATPAFAFKISIPAASGGTTATGAPTGAASTGTATGFLLPNGTKATFLFCSLDGVITGWNNKLGTAGAIAQVAINNSAAGAVYTDLALVTNTNGTYILAANFGKGATIEVYDSNFASAKMAGSFTDTTLPAGYVPYAVHVIGSQVFVTYALRATTGGPTIAPGDGMVNVFDVNGNFVAHAVTPGGNLNAPWGLAIAPTTFGVFGGALLVGNFGDGIINAYDPKTFAYLGQLADGTGKTLVYA
ncbi:MAG TPA: TIGR03118 family protein, partial [Edaphobacter sp.]|nr:TIGR03118 family protein [Edaphobacter sp.]